MLCDLFCSLSTLFYSFLILERKWKNCVWSSTLFCNFFQTWDLVSYQIEWLYYVMYIFTAIKVQFVIPPPLRNRISDCKIRPANLAKAPWAPFDFLLPPHYCGLGAGSVSFRAIVNNKQCEMRGLFMSPVNHDWIGDVQDCQGVSASEMTYIVSNGALNSTHSLTHWDMLYWVSIKINFQIEQF